MKRFVCLPFLAALCCFADETPPLDVIINDLPDPTGIRFTPPEPPKEIPPLDVQSTTSARFPTHRITILRGETSLLPDIPAPVEKLPAPSVTDVSRIAVDSIIHTSLSVSVFKDDLSRVEVFNAHTKTRHIAWCGWDMSLLAPVNQISISGKQHELSIFAGPAALTDLPADSPQPIVEPGSILITDGDDFTANILTALREAYSTHRRQLLAIRAAQDQYAKDAEAWKKANPPKPENHTIWFRPHRGSRYLQVEGGDQ